MHGFNSGEEALAFGSENFCEVAFLDIDMSDVDGIALAKHLKQVNPKVNIIFVTAHKKHAMEAFSLHSSGYVMKPATKEKREYELENLRHPVSLDKIACDYYNWMQGDIEAINAYQGEYMSQYSWGEFTLGGIEMTVAFANK